VSAYFGVVPADAFGVVVCVPGAVETPGVVAAVDPP
jgi:hypothetical protein